MVSCDSNKYQDKKNAYLSYKQFLPISPTKHFVVRDGKEITKVEELDSIILDERNLQRFPVQENGYVKRINIGASISHRHCKRFGVLLLGWNRISDISKTVEQNPDFPCEEILFKWLNMEDANYDVPITFRTLIDVIYELDEQYENDYNELANKIKFTVKIHKMMNVDYVPTLVRKYAGKVSERYQKDSVIDNLQWIPLR